MTVFEELALLDLVSILLYGAIGFLALGFWLWIAGSRLLGWPSPRDVVQEHDAALDRETTLDRDAGFDRDAE
ncbi:ABC transporter substrate-binding protein [Haloferax larsenii]|uniref:ABC transporter substrate-binding protein n=1 Tax=Haloferax larsenii TaxID=302484 RepID=A0ABY5RCZ3_HALLR|nr:ABC transporter substrate-binding protein [Haloferax larsenii]UVE49025.1 ABC transporter substrate-binding protein [Haloferax larsenii]